MVWYLWSYNRDGKPQGVYSHATALELHELSTWTSSAIHMTVPKNLLRTILDLEGEKKTQGHHLVEALLDARKRGLVVLSDMNAPWLSERERTVLRGLEAEGVNYKPEG